VGARVVTSPASSSSATAELERNPYSRMPDPSGRPLPYTDGIQVQVLAQDALDLRAANGDLDFQVNHLGYNTTQVYLENAEQRGYKVLRWAPTGSLLAMNFNLSHKDEGMWALFAEPDFRAAFSQAIDREDMNARMLGGWASSRSRPPPRAPTTTWKARGRTTSGTTRKGRTSCSTGSASPRRTPTACASWRTAGHCRSSCPTSRTTQWSPAPTPSTWPATTLP